MLSKKTKYAIHALTFLARKDPSVPTLIAEISEKAVIPRKFLESILLELKKAGILYSKMGKGGGYFLLKDPAEITMATIVRMFNGPIAMLPCVSLNYYRACEDCVDERSCGLHYVMTQVRDETLKVLENKSIRDILTEEDNHNS